MRKKTKQTKENKQKKHECTINVHVCFHVIVHMENVEIENQLKSHVKFVE